MSIKSIFRGKAGEHTESRMSVCVYRRPLLGDLQHSVRLIEKVSVVVYGQQASDVQKSGKALIANGILGTLARPTSKTFRGAVQWPFDTVQMLQALQVSVL